MERDAEARCITCGVPSPPERSRAAGPRQGRGALAKPCLAQRAKSGNVHFDTASPVFLEANGRCAYTNHVDSAVQPTAEKSESTSGEINYLALERCPVPFFTVAG